MSAQSESPDGWPPSQGESLDSSGESAVIPTDQEETPAQDAGPDATTVKLPRTKRQRTKFGEITKETAQKAEPDFESDSVIPERTVDKDSDTGLTSVATPPGKIADALSATNLVDDSPADNPHSEHFLESTSVVRPYALTGGRTKANYTLELETLVSTIGDDKPVSETQPEFIEQHHSIVEKCRTPRSVAELVSALRVPLGVARVLISDAADAGVVTVHKTVTGNDSAEAHLVLMERVLSGLRRL